MERPSIPRVIVTADGPMDWNEALDIIQSGSPEQVCSFGSPLTSVLLI